MENRILVKISGEYFGTETNVFDKGNVQKIAKALRELQAKSNRSLFVVVGGGNICRGRELSNFSFTDGGADHVGMLSTAQNALILKKVFDTMNVPSHVMAPFAAEMLQIHPYQAGKAKWWADEKSIVIFGGGLGLCGFSTDMASVSRAYEVGAGIVVKVSEVGALYTDDPKHNQNAQVIRKITHAEVLVKGYKVMDEEAFAFARGKRIAIKILSLDNLLVQNLDNEDIGTIISS